MPYRVQYQPAPPTGFGQFAQAFGGQLEKVQDLLLQAYLSGQLGQVPQGTVAPTGNLQNFQLSGGRQFSGTAQAAQRLIPQDIRGFQTQVNRGLLPATGLPQGLGFTPTGKSALRFQPPLTRELQQAQLEESRTKTRQAPFEEEKLREEARRLKAQADLYEKAAKGEVTFTTLPDGTIIPTFPSTTGPKAPRTDSKSARELAAEAEFGGLGTTPSGLPSPAEYPEGTIIRDTETGKRYRLSAGAWTPL